MVGGKAVTYVNPLEVVHHQVARHVDALFGDLTDAVYVSTPITTGKGYFALLRSQGIVTNDQRMKLRAANSEHAEQVVSHVQEHFPEQTVINPLRVNEPKDWSQDHFNGFWMLVISAVVKVHVVVNGWAYSTGCTWEVSQSIAEGLPILDESLQPLSPHTILEQVTCAGALIGQGTSWTPASMRLLFELREKHGGLL